MRRLLDFELHQVQKIGAATYEHRARSRHSRTCCSRVSDPLVGERLHRDTSPATARMAATMFGYAAHRQMLPLMRSRISVSDRAICPDATSWVTWLGQPAFASASMPTPEQICQRVQ